MRISFGTPLKYAHKSSVLPFMSAGRIHYKFVFNEGTADLVFQDLMEQSIKVAGGDRMGKTIIPLTKQDIAELEKILWCDVGTQQDYEAKCGQKPLYEKAGVISKRGVALFDSGFPIGASSIPVGTRLWNQSLVCYTFVQQTAAEWRSTLLSWRTRCPCGAA